MENKKNLTVNTAICDIRSASEETLSAYAHVGIDCAMLLSCPEARALLARHCVEVTAASTIELDADTQLSTINGKMHLTPGNAIPEKKTFLMLNGKLDIEPGAEEVLKSYAGMVVNGTVEAPESMVGLLSGVKVNGAIRTYPDGCIRLNPTTVLERTFPLRAKQGALYYAASRIIALSKDVDFQKLAEKNVRFATKKLLISEGLVEEALPLFDEKTDIQILPDGCAYLDDDAQLTEALVRRHGGTLYVDGDLTLLEDGPWLDQVAYLRVDGDILAAQGLENRLSSMDVIYKDLYLVGGTLLMGKPSVRLTRAMLESADRGLSVVSCAAAEVDEDVDPQLLRDRLVSIIACAHVVCTEEQRTAIEPLAQDVAHIGPKEADEENEENEDDSNTVNISAAFYTL